jgi:heme/copper-type cytochrome/quinol oxidase subunit 4
MYCINCTREIPDESNYCIYCGAVVNPELGPATVQRSNSTQIIIGCIGSFVLLVISWFIAVCLVIDNHRNDTLIYAVFAGLIFATILPTLILFLTKRKGYGKGALFGTLIFYLLAVLVIAAITSSF